MIYSRLVSWFTSKNTIFADETRKHSVYVKDVTYNIIRNRPNVGQPADFEG